ncbi:MAG: hypothetical protein ACI4IW_07950 [Oscillospiraceae bacterium]
MNKMRRGTRGPVILKFRHKFLLLALGLGFLIGGMAVYERFPWLFIVLAAIGALIIFIAAEGGRDVQRTHRPSRGKGSLSDSCVKKDKPFNPWDTVSGDKNGE